MLYQLSFWRIITIYIANSVIFATFIYLAYKILKQGRKRTNIYFSAMYITVSIGIFVNFIYGPLTNPDLIIPLNFITNYCITFGTIFLTIFIIILLKGEETFTTSKQLALIIIYGVLLFLQILIPEGVEVGPETGWSPHWSWPLFIYVIIILSVMSILPSLYYSIKVYKKFDDKKLKNKWKFFIIGTCELFVVLYGTFLTQTLNVTIIRIVWAPIALILSLTGAYLMYYGVAKKF